MWARTQLKIGWRDLAYGGFGCLLPGDRQSVGRTVETYWDDGVESLAAYSVRSGFDLLLQSLDLEPGDEVIFSALNVKGMIKIVKRLGLKPVPVDLDVEHMAPRLDMLEAAISERSKVIVVAHLFGTHVDLGPAIELAKRHELLLVEDCAQVFDGRAYTGDPDADVAMFSFGPLKTATALGGALVRVRDSGLMARMRELQESYPVQPNRKHLKRIFQFAALKVVTAPFVMRQIYRFFHKRGVDYEDSVGEQVRNVAPLGSSKKLRSRPSLGMLRLIERRMRLHPPVELEERAARGRRLRDLLGDSVVLPGQGNEQHSYWVFPLLVDEPRIYIDRLRQEGFDCADLPRSQAVEAPEDRPQLTPRIASQALADMVVVPCYADMPDSEIVRQAEVIREIAAEVGSVRTRAYATSPSSADAA